MKICYRCKVNKQLNEFFNNKQCKDGLSTYCKVCVKEYNKERPRDYKIYYCNNINKVKLKNKRYRENNPEKVRTQKRMWRRKNKDRINARKNKEYQHKKQIELELQQIEELNFVGPKIPNDYKICKKCDCLKHISELCSSGSKTGQTFKLICKKCQRKISSEKYWDNPEKSRQASKKSRNKNIEKTRKNVRDYRKSETGKRKRKEYESRPKIKIIKSQRKRLQLIVKDLSKKLGFKVLKQNHTIEYIGCNGEFLYNHLNCQLKEGMSWENYGRGNNKWNIDHWYPCEGFEFLEQEDFYIALNWTNLQPLWNTENSSKGDKLPDGRRARDSGHEYTNGDKKKFIFKNLKSKNLSHVSENCPFLPLDFALV